VCWAENVAVEGRALGLLCAQTECDVRSCLHTLQFLARRKAESSDGGGMVRVTDVQSAAAGRKDMTVAAMQAWEDIFCKKKASPFESECVRLQ
jgi:chromosome transmission fidelity protein 18